MPLTTLSEKIDFVRRTRSDNYRESMRLEGIDLQSKKKAMSKESIIEKYKALAS